MYENRGISLKKENKDIYFSIFLLLLFIMGCYFFYEITLTETEIAPKLLGAVVIYTLGYLLLTVILSRITHPFVKHLLYILGLPLILTIHLHHIAAPIVTTVMFFLFYLVPTSLVLMIIDTIPIIGSYTTGIIYLVNVLAVLVYAYFGNHIMNLIIFTTKPVLGKEFIQKYSSVLYTRILSYIMMIFIYLLYNFLDFSNKEEFLLLKVEQLSVFKEVLVTFVAVDTLIQIIIKWKSETKREV